MSTKHQVIIIQKGEVLPDGLRQSLQTKGYSTQVVSSETDVRSKVQESETVVVVYCSDSTETETIVSKLIDHTDLHAYPLILVGVDVDRYESRLNQKFVLATTITSPCASSDIIAAIEYVIRYVEKNRPRRVVELEESDAQAVHTLYKQFPSIPKLVFDQIQRLGILSKDIGGGKYATNLRPDRNPEKSFLPQHVGVRKSVLNIADALSDARAARYYRIGELSNYLFEAIGMSGMTLECARATAFLYSSSFIVEHRDLSMKEYLSESSALVRKELCSRIKDSAMNASTDFGSQQLSKMIASVAKFIGEEGSPGDSIEDLAASCVATADLVDRIVFQQGAFQPVPAYCLLAKLKTNPMTQIHPIVLGCIIKLLAEAVTSEASGLAKNKKLKNMAALVNAADEIKDLVLEPKENKVPLASLAPGMKLSRPLNTFDGKEILNHDLILDQDLIWRLWQLAAIRPLGQPIVVFTDS